MSESPTDELRAAYLDLQKAQSRIDADRDAMRKRMLESEPTWGPCLQCGHSWRSQNIRRRVGKPPRRCPNCKSAYWFDPEYIPRVPVQSGKAAGAESNGGQSQGGSDSEHTAPAAKTFEMSPPPKFTPEEDTLAMMKKVNDEEK